jgi:molybdenum cofactor cytidylyltransferase
MQLTRALRAGRGDVVALVGGGGKTTAMFRLAGEMQGAGLRVVTTMTTRIFVGQMALAPGRLLLHGEATLLAQLAEALAEHGHVLVGGSTIVEEDKVRGVPPEVVDRIAAHPAVDAVIVEADGSRGLPLKAPAPHEPVIPPSASIVVPVAGIDALGRPLVEGRVHRPERAAALSGLAPGDAVTAEALAAVLAHPEGGAKGLPPGARLVPFLNKVEDEAALEAAREVARLLLESPVVDEVAIGAARQPDPVREVWGREGAVLLAAGESRRFGRPKQLLPWGERTLVAHAAAQALATPAIAGLVVTVGASEEAVRQALAPLAGRLRIVSAPDWALGQSRSVRRGLAAFTLPGAGEPVPDRRRGAPGAPGSFSGVLFLLSDQPGVSPELLTALVETHRRTLAPVVAPRHGSRRGNPVLFDRSVFAEFAGLSGDAGARSIIERHRDACAWVEWPSSEVLLDIDTPEDYPGLPDG